MRLRHAEYTHYRVAPQPRFLVRKNVFKKKKKKVTAFSVEVERTEHGLGKQPGS